MDLPDEQLPHLETFSKAAELCSFTAAAKALGLTQAAVSQRVQILEKALDRSLFDRRGGRVLLTDAGKTLYDYAQRILDLHRQARTAVTGRESPVAGDLAIAASSVPGEHLLPAVLAGFGRRYPLVRVRAAVGDSAAVLGLVGRGEASVGLVGRRTDDAALEFRHLTDDRMVVVVPPGHPLASSGRPTLRDLATHPLVLREVGSGLRHCFETALARAGWALSDLRVALELGSNEAIKESVLSGVGAAVLSTLAVRKEVATGRLVAVQLDGVGCDREMFVVTDRRRVLSPAARHFVALLDAADKRPL